MSRVKQHRVHSDRPRTRRRATQAGRIADQARIRKGRDVRYDSPIREYDNQSRGLVTTTVTKRTGRHGRRPRGLPDAQLQATAGIIGMMDRFKRQKV